MLTDKIVIRERETFPGFGCCIYCRSTVNLAREHIVPLALHGTHIITDGSCEECAKQTHAFEGYCAGVIFGPWRMANRYPSRNKRGKKITRELKIEHGGKLEHIEVPYGQEPATPVVVPILETAGIIIGREPTESVPVKEMRLGVAIPEDLQERVRKFRKDGSERIRVPYRFKPYPFLRMLAKIGHGFAVACCGIDSFQHLLPPYILGKDLKLAHVVGGVPEDIQLTSPGEAGYGFRVGLVSLENGRHLVGVRFQILRNFGYPVYEIIAGEASPDLVLRLLGSR